MKVKELKTAVKAQYVNSIEFIGKNTLSVSKFTVDWKTVLSDETVPKMFKVPEITINGILNNKTAIKPIKLDFIAQEWDFINNEAFLIQRHDGFDMLFGDTPDYSKYANMFALGGNNVLAILDAIGIEEIADTKEKVYAEIKKALEAIKDIDLDVYVVEKKADSDEPKYSTWFIDKPTATNALGQRAASKAANFDKLFSDTSDAGHAKAIINIMKDRKTK